MPETAAATQDGQAGTETCRHGVPRHGYFVIRQTAAHETQVYCMCCGRPGVRDVDDAEPMPCPSCGVNAVLDNRGARS
jgi:hypothetical protein